MTKLSDPSSADLPSPMVPAHHRSPTAAFFKEIMRRDAMIGMKIEHALWDGRFILIIQRSVRRGKRNSRPGHELDILLKTRTMSTTRSTASNVSHITYRGKKHKQQEYHLTSKYKDEVYRRVSHNIIQDVRKARKFIRP